MGAPNKKWMIICVAAALVAILAVSSLGEGRRLLLKTLRERQRETKKDEMGPTGSPGLGFDMVEGLAEFGSPTAAVEVVAFIPSEAHGACGNETAVLLEQIYNANPEKLYLQVVDFDSAEGARLQTETGTHCAGVVVNDEQKIKVHDPEKGKEIEVKLDSNLGDKWSEDDLYLVLDKVFIEAYGAACERPKASTDDADPDPTGTGGPPPPMTPDGTPAPRDEA